MAECCVYMKGASSLELVNICPTVNTIQVEAEPESLGSLFGPQGVSGRQAYPMEFTHKPEGNPGGWRGLNLLGE